VTKGLHCHHNKHERGEENVEKGGGEQSVAEMKSQSLTSSLDEAHQNIAEDDSKDSMARCRKPHATPSEIFLRFIHFLSMRTKED